MNGPIVDPRIASSNEYRQRRQLAGNFSIDDGSYFGSLVFPWIIRLRSCSNPLINFSAPFQREGYYEVHEGNGEPDMLKKFDELLEGKACIDWRENSRMVRAVVCDDGNRFRGRQLIDVENLAEPLGDVLPAVDRLYRLPCYSMLGFGRRRDPTELPDF